MKIYTVGSASTGKTHIAKYISEKHNLPLITEAARQILAEREWSIDSLRANLQKVNQYQREVFYRQLQEEKKYEGQNFISDRGFDFMSYTLQFSKIGPEILATQEWKDYLESLKKEDVLILFVRPHKSLLKDDGVRESLTWESSIAIDAMTKALLQMYGLKYFQIDCVSMQERTNLVDNIIDLFLAKEKKKENKKTICFNCVDSLLTEEEWKEEKEKLQKELRARENYGFVKFGEEEKLVDLDWCNDKTNQYTVTNSPLEVKYDSVYDSNFLLGRKTTKTLNNSSFIGGEEIIAIEENRTFETLLLEQDASFKKLLSEQSKNVYKGEF